MLAPLFGLARTPRSSPAYIKGTAATRQHTLPPLPETLIAELQLRHHETLVRRRF
jgi:hypothetical protein